MLYVGTVAFSSFQLLICLQVITELRRTVKKARFCNAKHRCIGEGSIIKLKCCYEMTASMKYSSIIATNDEVNNSQFRPRGTTTIKFIKKFHYIPE